MNKLENLLNMVDSDMLMDMVNTVNNWNNSLEHLQYYRMEDINICLAGLPPVDIMNKMYYGNFNPNHQYFRFDEYGNLVSYTNNEVAYSLEEDKEDIVKLFIELSLY